MSNRIQAAEAYIKALRTGEPSATQAASQYLAEDVGLKTGNDERGGRDNVVKAVQKNRIAFPVSVKSERSSK